MIIAIDGPAGAGKSTVCRMLARELRFLYLDTGAMYRAVAWALLHERVDRSEDAIAGQLPVLPLTFSVNGDRLEIRYRDRLLQSELRNPEMSDAASRISQLKPVRDFLLLWQRRVAEQGNIVAEGRDTTTVVFPDAELKVFLTADLQTRMRRRFAEYREKGIEITQDEMELRIRGRDEADANRDLAPMRQAQDAMLLDTSHLDIQEVVDRLVDAARARMRARS